MSEENQLSQERFEQFGKCIVEAMSGRFEGGAKATPVDMGEKAATDLVAAVEDSVLVAPLLWGEAPDRMTGLMLWTGPVSVLLGVDPQPMSELSDEDASALGNSLRLQLEEGGEDEAPLPLEWETMTLVPAGDLEAYLSEAGIENPTPAAHLAIKFEEHQFDFTFLPGPPATEDVSEEMENLANEEPEGGAETEEDASASAGSVDGIPSHLLELKIPLSIRLGSTTMNLDEVLKLSAGAIVELDQRDDEPLEVIANGKVIAHGEVVVVDERFGLRISKIGSSSDRLRAI